MTARPWAQAGRLWTWTRWLFVVAIVAGLLWGWRSRWANNEPVALAVALALGLAVWHSELAGGVSANLARRWPRLLTVERLVWLGGGLFVVVTGGFAVARWLSFNASRDLALMDQLAWNSARGAWLQGSFWTGEPINYLGGHVSPILALLGPLYWVAPSPGALLVLQSLSVAGAAAFLFLAARALSGRPSFALGVTAVVLLHPRLHIATLSDFRQDGVGLLFMAMGLYGLLADKRGWAVAGVALSLLAKEEIALYWLVFGLVLSVGRPAERRRFLAVALVAALWFVAAMFIIRPAFLTATASAEWLFTRYADFGSEPRAIVWNVVSDPLHTLDILRAPGRVAGVLVTVLPFLVLWWHGRWWHPLLLAPLGINLLSVDGVQHRLLGHYALLPLAAVGLVTLLAAERQAAREDDGRWRRLTAAMVTMGVVLYLWLSPLGLMVGRTATQYTVDSHDRQGALVADRIPSDGVVVAQAAVASHLAHRPYLTIFPIETVPPPDYYVFDLSESGYPLPQDEVVARVQLLLDDPDYGVLFYGDGLLVLQKGAGRGGVDAARTMAERFR